MPTKHGAVVSYFVWGLLSFFFLRFVFFIIFNWMSLGTCMCAQVLSETTGIPSPGAGAAGRYERYNMSTGK